MRLSLALICVLCLSACQSTYFSVWEKLGVEKREILVDRVEDVNDAQQEAQQQFESALEELTALIGFDGGELQSTYESLRDQHQASQDSADRLESRIAKVQSVAEALFDEWQAELDQYQNENLRRDSARKLKDTQRKYQQLHKTMQRSVDKMQPVLLALNDNVLYLKHNLNANAIGALQGEFEKIKRDIKSLVNEMNQAIAQSSAFIDSIKQG
jgi:hydroxymethylpyrimidine pyrophosphatase-like HAD family hydrolase